MTFKPPSSASWHSLCSLTLQPFDFRKSLGFVDRLRCKLSSRISSRLQLVVDKLSLLLLFLAFHLSFQAPSSQLTRFFCQLSFLWLLGSTTGHIALFRFRSLFGMLRLFSLYRGKRLPMTASLRCLLASLLHLPHCEEKLYSTLTVLHFPVQALKCLFNSLTVVEKLKASAHFCGRRRAACDKTP